MPEILRKDNPAKCAVCDTYNLKGLWTCECGALNVSSNKRCWKCSLERGLPLITEEVGGPKTG
jgi:hypothetical protein